LEVYAETNDAGKFDGQYAFVLASHDNAARERATTLRQQLSGAGEYTPSEVSAEAQDSVLSDAALVDELTLDDGLDFDLDTAGDVLSEGGSLDFERDLDLDLDLDLDDSADASELTGDDLSFDLDLGLDEAGEVLSSEGEDEFSLELELGDDHLQDELTLEGDLDALADDASGDFEVLALDDVDSLESGLELDEGESLDSAFDEMGDPSYDLSDELGADDAPKLSDLASTVEPGFDLDFDLESDTLSAGDDSEDGLSADLDLALELDGAVDLGESLEVVPSADEAGAGDDHFDMDLGDIDLASLDQELDTLSAGLDLDVASDEFSALVLDESVEVDLTETAGLMSADLEMDDELSLEFAVDDKETFELDASEAALSSLDSLELEVPELDVPVLEDFELEIPELDAHDLGLSELEALDLDTDAQSEAVLDMAEPLLELSDDVDDFTAEFDSEGGIEVADLEPEFDLAADLGLNEAAELPSTEEGMFDAALADLPEPEEVLEGEFAGEEDAELDFLADTDEAATKLDLARAYIDMGDQEGAKDILDEVVQEGSEEQRSEADELLARMN